MNKKIVIGVVILVLLCVSAFLFLKQQSGADQANMVYHPVQVERGTIQLTISSAGTIVPKTEIEVKSKASGKILRIYVRDGDRVKKGQLLLELDKTEEETKVKQAQATVLSAEAKVIQAKERFTDALRNEAQSQALLDDKLISLETYLKAKSDANSVSGDVKIAAASLMNAQEGLKNAQVSYADTEILAPIDGMVLERLVEEGQIISSGISASSGGTKLFSIGDMSQLLSKSDVDEVDIGKLKIGQPAQIEVDAYEGRVFRGKLSHISPKGVNQSNVTVFAIEIDITDPHKMLLKAGLTNTAKIIVEEKKDVLLLPTYAVTTIRNQSQVYIKEKNQYVAKKIKTGLNNYEQVEIVSGLSEGDMVYFSSSRSSNNQSSRQMGAQTRRLAGPH